MPAAVRLNPSQLVHETIDGETIMIHLGTGTYYSLSGAGSEVWQWLASGATRDGVLAVAKARYFAHPHDVELGVEGLIEDLLREGLLVEGPPDGGSAAPSLPGEKVPFAMSALQVYTDMQEFMLVDPLHDVDEAAGWPHAKVD